MTPLELFHREVSSHEHEEIITQTHTDGRLFASCKVCGWAVGEKRAAAPVAAPVARPRVLDSSHAVTVADGTKGVYFAYQAGMGRVKIGKSNDINKRLGVLKTGCSTPLHLMAFDPNTPEAVYHRRFDHVRTQGEWFQLTDELAEVINKLRREMGDRDFNRKWFDRLPDDGTSRVLLTPQMEEKLERYAKHHPLLASHIRYVLDTRHFREPDRAVLQRCLADWLRGTEWACPLSRSEWRYLAGPQHYEDMIAAEKLQGSLLRA